MSALPLPEEAMHEEDEGLVSPYQPFDSTPAKATGHPFAIVWRGLMQHQDGVMGGKVMPADEKCCRPFAPEEKPEPVVDPLPGRVVHGRLAALPVSEWPLMTAPQTEVRRKKWKRPDELKARR